MRTWIDKDSVYRVQSGAPSKRHRCLPSWNRIQYKTEYACEGSTLNISCKDNYVIHLVRANYGRLSVSICNPLAKSEWSVNCMSWKSHLIMEKKCMNKQTCSVQVSAKNFDDPCPGTIKYLEVQYNCTLEAGEISTNCRFGLQLSSPVIIPTGAREPRNHLFVLFDSEEAAQMLAADSPNPQ
ncbi:latrophilin Cirl-like [Tropilaelaps mercedesae]|uniref:Latrophilin Cirl-like n=1 Tax=Tropilaelaps mercedesae TaxID=418985 RepID=A0A1V9X475_9ACAR|nr:latrophilin Cirl-like [Tropilaelaps mercedesae]